MANSFHIKRGDTSPTLVQTLLDSAGAAVSLAGATANIHVFTRRGVSVVDEAVIVFDAEAGIINYDFAGIAQGNYDYEIEVTYSDASIETFPNAGFDLLIVERDLS